MSLFAKLPKAELHLHLEGSVRPTTAFELAAKNGVAFPGDPATLYSYDDLPQFLKVYAAVASAMRTAQDFHRTTYEMLEGCAQSGARHVEFFISPHARDVDFAVQFDGIVNGLRDAQRDFGLTALFAPGINREWGPQAAEDYLDAILAMRVPEMAGVGLDYNEAPFPPDPYAAVFARARAMGLQTSAHAGEGGPAAYVRGSIAALGVARIDHGYAVVDDPKLVAECLEKDILFTCCPSTSQVTTRHRDLAAADHPIRLMREAGLRVTINSDDPPYFGTTLAREYEIAHRDLGFSMKEIKTSILTGLAGSWMNESEKTRLAPLWAAEIDALILQG